ncbi:MAG: hypothetical protein ACYC99_12455 [Candidatus Geothermincolia bacterium]
MIVERIVTTCVLALSDWSLVKIINPTPRELRAVLTTAGIVAAGDFVVESLMGRLKVWEYHMPCAVNGLPVDLAPDLGLVTFAFCMGLSWFGRSPARRRVRPLFVLTLAVAVGTEAWIKNRRAARDGTLTFGRGIDTESPMFAMGNYATITALLLLIAGVHRAVLVFLGGSE